jgi:hypothetical protein
VLAYRMHCEEQNIFSAGLADTPPDKSILGAGPGKASKTKIIFESIFNISFSFLQQQNSLYSILDITTFSVGPRNLHLSLLRLYFSCHTRSGNS